MKPSRLIAIPIAFFISSAFALTARAEVPYESEIQYALEHLVSGVFADSQINGTKVRVMPIRTWKSISGHYCRQYELTIAKPASAPDHIRSLRCRDGRWLQPNAERQMVATE